MSALREELEEIKTLTIHQLSSIDWPLSTPNEASYANEFANHMRNELDGPSPGENSRKINEFSNLRNTVLSVLVEHSIRDNSSLEILEKYYCQLIVMMSRFKKSDATFSWKVPFSSGSTKGNLYFELDNIIYNIAAIHNELGAKILRSDVTTTKEACLHFCRALGWIKIIRRYPYRSSFTKTGQNMVNFFIDFLEAQAQECELPSYLKPYIKTDEMALVSAYITWCYMRVAHKITNPLIENSMKEVLSESTYSTWRANMDFKYNYFYALTQLLQALSCRDDNAKEIGVRISRLRKANQKLNLCKKSVSEDLDSQSARLVFEAIDSLVTRKLDKAVCDNDNVYHSTIPNFDDLPEVFGGLVISREEFNLSNFKKYEDIFCNLYRRDWYFCSKTRKKVITDQCIESICDKLDSL